MSVKEQYKIFEENNYIPIYSRHWWMDAVCEAENWNVWVYEKEGDILAAMPYYIEKRGKYIVNAFSFCAIQYFLYLCKTRKAA